MQFKYLCIHSGKSQNGTISDKTKKASFLFWHVFFKSSFSSSGSFITIDFTISVGINHIEMFLIHGVSIEHPVLESQAIFAVHFFPIQSHASVGITNTSNNADSSFDMSVFGEHSILVSGSSGSHVSVSHSPFHDFFHGDIS